MDWFLELCKDIPLAKKSHEGYMLKNDSSQCWLIYGVEIWGGGGKSMKSGGAVAPSAPLVPPPMSHVCKS